MKIKDRIKAFLQNRGSLVQQACQSSQEKANSGKSKKKKKKKMSYKRNTSKSMMDLSRPAIGSDDSQPNQQKPVIRASASYWNVDGSREFRKKGPAPEPPPRISVNSPSSSSNATTVTKRRPSMRKSSSVDSNASLSSHNFVEQSRPKRVSSVQFADVLGKNSIEEEVEEDINNADVCLSPLNRDHRSSTGSSTSSATIPPAGSYASSASGSVASRNLPQAQSMMQLSRYHKGSFTSDEEPKGLRKKSSSALHALKNLSRSTPAMSPSASPRHSDSEGPPRISKGTKKFMRHFADAPASERVLNYFSCALVSDILLQGTLYITSNYFAFYSKIFGHVSRLLIPITQVATVQKERTAKIIPNAVGLQMVDGKSYVFGSLLSRDSTYKLMSHLWKKAQKIQDSDSEPQSGVPLVVEDDIDDSGSASGESYADEPDGGGAGSYIARTAISSLTGVASSAAAPWARNTSTTTTSATPPIASTTDASTILTSPTIATSSNTNSSSNNALPPSLAEVASSAKLAIRRDSKTSTKNSPENQGGGILEWFTEGTVVKTCFRMGSIPLKIIADGMREIWALPRTSLLLLISTMLLLMLFASAAFMLHRVDMLSQQLGIEKYDGYDGMYEEVLQMQQRLHAAASSEIEKTLSIQLKHIATVRQSLEALVVLFNKEPPMNTARIPDNT